MPLPELDEVGAPASGGTATVSVPQFSGMVRATVSVPQFRGMVLATLSLVCANLSVCLGPQPYRHISGTATVSVAQFRCTGVAHVGCCVTDVPLKFCSGAQPHRHISGTVVPHTRRTMPGCMGAACLGLHAALILVDAEVNSRPGSAGRRLVSTEDLCCN